MRYINHFYGMRLRSLLLASLLIITPLQAETLMWVFLTSMPNSPPVHVTRRAHARIESKGHLHPGGQLRIPESTLEAIRSTGVELRYASRFLNAVSVSSSDPDQIEQLRGLEEVSHIRHFSPARTPSPLTITKDPALNRSTTLDYGSSALQNEMLQIPDIHDLGYDGSGILMAVFDAGFHLDHPAFDEVHIEATYDFVDGETDPDGDGQDHGNNVLSALAGYAPGQLIGPAYGASFLLARTENDNSESLTEEENWVAALEWADSLGVDIVSSSVNYREFDNPDDNYPYSSMDGATAITTMAANVAAERGILIVNSVANEGPASGTLWPPADSPHVLAVGAVSATGNVMNFSSRGPTFDGRIKPDVVTLGSSVLVAAGTQSYRQVSGTSFSAPLVAGLAALLLESNPSLAPDAIIQIFHEQSDQSSNPDNNYGFGVPQLLSKFHKQSSTETILVYPNPVHANRLNLLVPSGLDNNIGLARIYDIRGRLFGSLQMHGVNDHEVSLDLSQLPPLSNQIYFISFSLHARHYSAKFIQLKS